jgi:hypothetical protein
MTKELLRVRRAAEKAASTRTELHAAVRAATQTTSLREVAAAAGLSHEQVRRIARSG